MLMRLNANGTVIRPTADYCIVVTLAKDRPTYTGLLNTSAVIKQLLISAGQLFQHMTPLLGLLTNIFTAYRVQYIIKHIHHVSHADCGYAGLLTMHCLFPLVTTYR